MPRMIFRKFMLQAVIVPAYAFIAAMQPSGALASQGPGIAEGTASATTQIAMAIIVWGASGALVAMGLIGAVRQR